MFFNNLGLLVKITYMQLITEKSKDYELIDSGDGEKLERYGRYTLRRPDPQVLWPKSLSQKEWERADSTYLRSSATGKWLKPLESWRIELEGLVFNLSLLPSKHLGVFPEQSEQWKWMEERIKTRYESTKHANDTNKKTKIKVLNLFGYTGGATLACARAGAEVVHVDSSKFAVDLAHKNLDDSKLGDRQVRFFVDDVRKFVEREIKRGNKYDIITMDPPIYGKGSKGEIWKIEENLTPLLSKLKKIISSSPIAIVLNGYASGYSHLAYSEILKGVTVDFKGKVTSGELAIKDSTDKLLPCGIFARWENEI